MFMKKMICRYLSLSLSGLLLWLAVGCAGDDDFITPPVLGETRTVLIYMAADNNLSSYVHLTMSGLEAGMRNSKAVANHLIVYLDRPGESPCLMEVTPSGSKQVKRYESYLDSTDPGVMRRVIDEVCDLYPADRYGMVLWSHATAWLPHNSPYMRKSLLRQSEVAYPPTRSFGVDHNPDLNKGMELADLAQAIPDKRFDYLLFDACFMANVEVAYALRNKTDYLIASCAEVIADGFPYAAVTGELVKTYPDLTRVCRLYYEYYAWHEDRGYRSATVSLTSTAGLEALAQISSEIVNDALRADPNVIGNFNTGLVQHYDRFRQHTLFDLDHFMEHLATDRQYSRFSAQLGRTVLYMAATPYFMDEIILDRHSGLSCYIPVSRYADLNAYYAQTEWWKRISR